MIEKGEDPGAMNGRAIAAKLFKHAKDPARNWDSLEFWAGVACARLIEYQDMLEQRGLIEASHAGEAGGAGK